MSETLESGIYHGIVHHQRFVPKIHRFNYRIYLYWLKLSELPTLNEQVRGFSTEQKGVSPVKFLRPDFLGEPTVPIEGAVLERM